MQGQVVKKVVVAGGGSAGWMAAAALSGQLGALLDITLVESDAIGIVGVGESTIPTARAFVHLLGLDEREFMRETGATFKLGILFENWGQVGDRYIHSFGQVGKSTLMAHFHHMWMRARDQGFGGDLGDYCLELRASEEGKFYKADDYPMNYAYHIDATRFGQYLRRRCENKGVRRVEGKIREVQQHPETGDITALVLESGARVEGDLFIDCTGFRALLIEQTLKAGFEDWGQWLPNDRAIACQTRTTKPPMPLTRAAAHTAGWQWGIPLQHREGNGWVYSSEFMSEDEATTTFLSQLKGEKLTEPWKLQFRPGRRRKAWDKNCVAIGLASGFIEPLEATSLHMIMIAVTRLLQLFPFHGVNDALQTRFNFLANQEIERIRDFIILHYNATERTDTPYWNRCRTMDIPASLKERIELFRETAQVYHVPGELFLIDSWLQVMLGQRIQPKTHHLMGALMPPEQLAKALGDLKRNIDGAVAKLPTHQAFLERYCPVPAEAMPA
jgi:tryptophan halogenase